MFALRKNTLNLFRTLLTSHRILVPVNTRFLALCQQRYLSSNNTIPNGIISNIQTPISSQGDESQGNKAQSAQGANDNKDSSTLK